MPTNESTIRPDDATPNWEETLDLPCPRCGYNLRMLTVARCPECGLVFRWREIIEAANATFETGGFFEFDWQRRPLGAFLTTVARTLTPWRFWRRMPIAAKPHVLVLLVMIPLTFLLLLAMSALGDLAWHEYQKLYAGKFLGQKDFSGFPWYFAQSQSICRVYASREKQRVDVQNHEPLFNDRKSIKTDAIFLLKVCRASSLALLVAALQAARTGELGTALKLFGSAARKLLAPSWASVELPLAGAVDQVQ